MSPHAIAIALSLLAATPVARADPTPRVALHLGTGGGGWRIAGHPGWFNDNLAKNPLELLAAAEAEGPLAWRLRGGARASALYMDAGDDQTRTSLLLSRLEAFARLRPRWTAGPYLQAGLGPAMLRYHAEVPGLASGTLTAWGGSFALALGGYVAGDGDLEFRLEGEAAVQGWLPKADGPDLSLSLGATLGVAW